MSSPIYYCSKCGEFATMPNPEKKCSYCKTPYKTLNGFTTNDYYYKLKTWEEREQKVEEIFETIIKPNPDFDQKTYENRLKFEEAERNRPIDSASYIHCPNCKSTQVQRISVANKVGSAALFGIFAVSHVGKSYKCKTCKYEW